MGGAVSVNFASYFPNMVNSLVLLAPASLMRPENVGRANKFLFSSGLIPESLVLWLVKNRLQAGPVRPGHKPVGKKPDVKDVANAEATNP